MSGTGHFRPVRPIFSAGYNVRFDPKADLRWRRKLGRPTGKRPPEWPDIIKKQTGPTMTRVPCLAVVPRTCLSARQTARRKYIHRSSPSLRIMHRVFVAMRRYPLGVSHTYSPITTTECPSPKKCGPQERRTDARGCVLGWDCRGLV